MATPPPIRLPKQWPRHIKSGILHAISLASVVIACAHARTARRKQLRAQLDQAHAEIALLREELSIKDKRWERSKSKRRPHYTPVQRMRILQLRAARGWHLEKTARVFLVDLQTLLHWMRRVDEGGEHTLVKMAEPVNRYPDFVRVLVQQLKRLFPTMRCKRIAQFLARAGLALSATTVRRMIRERTSTPERDGRDRVKRRRRVVAKYPGHVWHVDLTTVPTRAGFWVPWFPFALPQRWPFCWWVAVAIDQMSRSLVGFEVFWQMPSSAQVQSFLTTAVRSAGQAPRYVVTDKGKQFWCRSFKRWCRRRRIRPRYCAVGQSASIAIVERFIRSMKQECTRCLLVPTSLFVIRSELRSYAIWYNSYRPHATLGGDTPHEACLQRATRRRRLEPRDRRIRGTRRRRTAGDKFALSVSYVEGRRHLPVIELHRAA